MLIPTPEIKKILEALLAEGVLVCKANIDGLHPTVGVKNLYVVQLMRSFESKEYVRRTFAWRHHYYYLTEKGANYIRERIHVSEEFVPKTHIKPAEATRIGGGPERGERGRRDDYRRSDKEPAPAAFGAVGRGAGSA